MSHFHWNISATYGPGNLLVRLPSHNKKKRSDDFILLTFLCCHIYRVSDKSIGLFLRYAFTSRYKEVLSKSHSSSMMTMPKFVPRLTKEESRGMQTSPL